MSILKENQVYRQRRKSDHATGEQGISTTNTPQTRVCVSSAPFNHPPNISDFHKSIMYVFNVGESKCTLYGSLNCYVNQGAGQEVVRESRPLVFDACKYSEHMPTVVTRTNRMYTQKVVVRERLLSNAYLVQTSQAFKIKLGRSFVCGSDS